MDNNQEFGDKPLLKSQAKKRLKSDFNSVEMRKSCMAEIFSGSVETPLTPHTNCWCSACVSGWPTTFFLQGVPTGSAKSLSQLTGWGAPNNSPSWTWTGLTPGFSITRVTSSSARIKASSTINLVYPTLKWKPIFQYLENSPPVLAHTSLAWRAGIFTRWGIAAVVDWLLLSASASWVILDLALQLQHATLDSSCESLCPPGGIVA